MRSSIRFTPGLLSRLDRGGPNPKSTLEAGSLPSARRANKHGLEVLAATIWASVALSGYAQSQLFTCTTNNGTITITGYLGTNVVVAIPATINGLPVTSIEGTRVFLTHITLHSARFRIIMSPALLSLTALPTLVMVPSTIVKA